MYSVKIPAMEQKKLQELINWLNLQINYTSNVISDNEKTRNIGRKIQYEGMRDAFIDCLNALVTNGSTAKA